MKPVFFRAVRHFAKKLFFCLIAFGMGVVPFAAEATDAIWRSSDHGTLFTSPPQIDATNFLNTGVWTIFTAPQPFETANTLNYTNQGSMTGSIGWEFDHGPIATGRGLSANFLNDNNAIITAQDGLNNVNIAVSALQSFLWVSATNIINKGLLIAGASGEIRLIGNNVLLARSGLEITPIASTGLGSFNEKTNFVPDIGIYDEWWTAGTNRLTVSGAVAAGSSVGQFRATGVHEPCGITNAVITIGPFTADVVDSYATNSGHYQLILTNSSGAAQPPIDVYSNVYHQAVYVRLGDPNITAVNHFSPSLNPTNPFQTVAVRFVMTSTNSITLTLQTSTLYLVDDLASSTNRALLANLFINPAATCNDTTFRPANYVLSRIDPGDFAAGTNGMGVPPANFFYDSTTFSNFTVSGIADTYSALIDNLASEPPTVGLGANITNAPGRVHIYAHDLDLSKTRISAQSEIMIQATNLINSAGAVMDSQNLSYTLGATNGFLNITNLATSNVSRLQGTISTWSGLWTNYAVAVYPNFITNSTAGGFTESDVTNITEVDLAITVVDASALSSTVPVTVQDLILHSTNIVISDSMTINNSFLLDGQSVTLLGNLTDINWSHATVPSLRYFTNSAHLDILNAAHFGDDGPTNYAVFVNHGINGIIVAYGQTINSDYLEINGGGSGGNETLYDDFVATCKTGLVNQATILAGLNGPGGNIQFFANSLQFTQAVLTAFNALDFTVTNNLSDGGTGDGSIFSCQNGFNLFIKPLTGDLFGTTVTNIAFDESEVISTWAGHDVGASPAGYVNNVAIGKLVLSPQGSPLFEPLFHFTGATANNAMYVGNLDLSQLSDPANEIQIDPNMTIYFVSAEVNPGLIAPFPSAEAYLDNNPALFGARLRQVPGGPVSGLLQQKISGSMTGGKFQLNVIAASGQTNIVEASTNLMNWTPIYTNVGSAAFSDTQTTNYPSRFYRIITLP